MSESTAEPRVLPLKKAAPVLAMHISKVQTCFGRTGLRTGLAMALPVLVAWLVIEMLLDWHLDLPFWARAMFLLAGLGATGAVAWKFGVQPWLRRPADDEIALAIERALPELRSRFIASIQLSRIPQEHAEPLVRALVKETTERTRGLEFTDVVPRDRLRRWRKVAFAAIAVGCSLWWLGGNASWPLLKRAFLSNIPKPSNTQIVGFSGDRVLAMGDDLILEANAAGVIPARGTLIVQAPRGDLQNFTLEPDPAKAGRFIRGVQSVQESFTYWIELGDIRTRQSHVQVRPRPTILQLALEQQWPGYTGFPAQPRSPSNLKLLAGSRLAVQLKPNVPLREARADLMASDGSVCQSTPLEPNAAAGCAGTINIPAAGATGLTFHLTDDAGVESKNMVVYRLEIIPDTPPEFTVLWPSRREELVTRQATIAIAFEAKDDHGLGRIKFHYAVNWTEGSVHKTVEFELPVEPTKTLARRFEWNFAKLTPPLQEGDLVDYWFEVADNNDVTGPGVTILPQHYQARVVSEDEKRAELAARLADTVQGLSPVHQNQEELASKLGELIYQKKRSP